MSMFPLFALKFVAKRFVELAFVVVPFVIVAFTSVAFVEARFAIVPDADERFVITASMIAVVDAERLYA